MCSFDQMDSYNVGHPEKRWRSVGDHNSNTYGLWYLQRTNYWGYIPTKARFGAPHYMNLTNIWISIQNMGSWNKIWVSEKGQQELFNWPLVPRSHRPKTTARYGTDFTISQFRTDQPALENICTFLKTWCIHCFFNQPVGMEHLLGRSKCNWRLCPWKKQISDGSQDVIIPQ